MCKEYKCIECGQEGATNVVQINSKSDSILFPHIDSCLAIIFEMKDGAAIGGHALHPGVYDGKGEVEEVVGNMIDMIINREIEKVYLIGDSHYETDDSTLSLRSLTENIEFIDKGNYPIDAKFIYKNEKWEVELRIA